MLRFKQALRETKAQMGVNLPTALCFVVAAAVTIGIQDNFSDPDLSSPPTFMVWLAESLGWSLSVVAVLLPFLIVNYVRISRRQSSVDAAAEHATRLAASVDGQVKLFLTNSLNSAHFDVAACYAFGSVVRDQQTRDIDVIIQFGSSDPARVRSERQKLRQIERTCQQVYGLQLHLQTFLQSEDDALLRFLEKAGDHEKLL